MAVSAFLKVAAAQLQRGSLYLKQQARDLVVERDRRTRQKADEISRHQMDIKLKQVELGAKDDDREKAALAQQVKEIQRQVDNKQQEVKQVAQELTDAARTKQQAADALLNKAKDLESQAGSPDFAE